MRYNGVQLRMPPDFISAREIHTYTDEGVNLARIRSSNSLQAVQLVKHMNSEVRRI